MYFSDNLVLNTYSKLKFSHCVAIGAKYGIESKYIPCGEYFRSVSIVPRFVLFVTIQLIIQMYT